MEPIPLAVSEHIAAAVPGAKLVTIPSCGHFAYLERPDEVLAAPKVKRSQP